MAIHLLADDDYSSGFLFCWINVIDMSSPLQCPNVPTLLGTAGHFIVQKMCKNQAILLKIVFSRFNWRGNFHSSVDLVLCCKLLLSNIIIIQNGSLSPLTRRGTNRRPNFNRQRGCGHMGRGKSSPRAASGVICCAAFERRNINEPVAF